MELVLLFYLFLYVLLNGQAERCSTDLVFRSFVDSGGFSEHQFLLPDMLKNTAFMTTTTRVPAFLPPWIAGSLAIAIYLLEIEQSRQCFASRVIIRASSCPSPQPAIPFDVRSSDRNPREHEGMSESVKMLPLSLCRAVSELSVLVCPASR